MVDISEKDKEQYLNLKSIANRFYSSPEGKIYGRMIFKASRMFSADTEMISADKLQYRSGQRDFANMILTNLVDRDVLLEILRIENE